MSAFKLLVLFVYKISIMGVAVFMAISTLFFKIHLIASIITILSHITDCAAAYFLGGQGGTSSDIKRLSEAYYGTAQQERTGTLHIVVQVLDHDRRVTTLEQSLTESEQKVEDPEQTVTKPNQVRKRYAKNEYRAKAENHRANADHAYLKIQVVPRNTMWKSENQETTSQKKSLRYCRGVILQNQSLRWIEITTRMHFL